jgi:hypothetical protein
MTYHVHTIKISWYDICLFLLIECITNLYFLFSSPIVHLSPIEAPSLPYFHFRGNRYWFCHHCDSRIRAFNLLPSSVSPQVQEGHGAHRYLIFNYLIFLSFSDLLIFCREGCHIRFLKLHPSIMNHLIDDITRFGSPIFYETEKGSSSTSLFARLYFVQTGTALRTILLLQFLF